jgi:hypothetical protein
METIVGPEHALFKDHRRLTAERSDLLIVNSLSRSFTGLSLLLMLQT